MQTYKNLYQTLYSYENLILAEKKARKRKTLKQYVIDFEENLENNINSLSDELRSQTYSPESLTTFIVRDPKTRRISASTFRDRVVHHALINVIGPIFEKRFIQDSFANQIDKGTHKAIIRFEKFSRKVGKKGYVYKADVRHYFDTVDRKILIKIISKKIKDPKVMWLISRILNNYNVEITGNGMPIGNLTSQFFANVYLNELDQFVKHTLKAKYYIRYVDDFVVLNKNKEVLSLQADEIKTFIQSNLKIELHPDKSKILKLDSGVTLLGFRVFDKYRLLKRSNSRRIFRRLALFRKRNLPIQLAQQRLEGWRVYADFANTYNLQRRVLIAFNKIYMV